MTYRRLEYPRGKTIRIRGGLRLAACLVLLGIGADEPPPRLLHDDFERDKPTGWAFADPGAWRIATIEPGTNRVLELVRQSQYEPAVRSPFNLAIAEKVDVTDFVLDVRLRSTTKDYGHRDMVLAFGHVDASHFYYVHFANQADEHANSIFLVDGKPRVSIAENRTKGTAWGDGWHHARIVRHVGDGLIQVFFDDMTRPVMTAKDRTFVHGAIGVGSFDDMGMVDDVELRGALHTAGDFPAGGRLKRQTPRP